jgi:hypothetical protein
MRRIVGTLSLVMLAPASVGLAQESLCNPCVDPPLFREFLTPPRTLREFSESLQAMPSPRADAEFNLGLTVANLRGLNAPGRSQTLTLVNGRVVREEEEAAEAQVDSADAAPSETDASHGNSTASTQNPNSTEE